MAMWSTGRGAIVLSNNGPVAAADARIEATFTGDATSYIGDREIITGIAEVTFVNESGSPAWLMIERYVTGSDELADELAFVAEGANAFPGQRPPSGVQLFESYGPGSHTVPVILAPGTYIFDAGFDNEDPAQVWRAAVIEVVSD